MMLLFVLDGWSQSTSASQQIDIKFKNGNSVQINANNVDYIDFTEDNIPKSSTDELYKSKFPLTVFNFPSDLRFFVSSKFNSPPILSNSPKSSIEELLNTNSIPHVLTSLMSLNFL